MSEWKFDEKRYEGHTHGHWVADGRFGQEIRVYEACGWETVEPVSVTSIAKVDRRAGDEFPANRKLIQDAPILLAEVIRLRERISELESQLRERDEALSAAAYQAYLAQEDAAAAQGRLRRLQQEYNL